MTEQATRTGRGRRPAAEVRSAALNAAADLLLSEGIAAVTHERVAARAAVSKTTLYKWWPSAGALAADAYFERSAEPLTMPQTGDIEADLKVQLHGFARLLDDPAAGRALRGLFAAAQTDLTVRAAFAERYVEPRRRIGGRALTGAQQAGQLRPDVDVQVLIDQIWGACYFRWLTEAEPLTPEYTDSLVDNLLAGARSAPR